MRINIFFSELLSPIKLSPKTVIASHTAKKMKSRINDCASVQAAIPQIMHYLDQMHSGQQHLLHLWQIKKTKLEQCMQLRVFEQDCEKVMSDMFFSLALCAYFVKQKEYSFRTCFIFFHF